MQPVDADAACGEPAIPAAPRGGPQHVGVARDDARAQAEAAAAVVKESRAAMMELEAARVSMREQLLVARAESEEQKAQLAGLLRTGGLYGYGH